MRVQLFFWGFQVSFDTFDHGICIFSMLLVSMVEIPLWSTQWIMSSLTETLLKIFVLMRVCETIWSHGLLQRFFPKCKVMARGRVSQTWILLVPWLLFEMLHFLWGSVFTGEMRSSSLRNLLFKVLKFSFKALSTWNLEAVKSST